VPGLELGDLSDRRLVRADPEEVLCHVFVFYCP
jgi:hypothetical protein